MSSETEEELRSKGTTKTHPIMVEVKVDNCIIPMEVDTGASVSLMPYSTFARLWPGRSVEPTSVRLRTYSLISCGQVQCKQVVGKCNVNNGHSGVYSLFIVESAGATLLGLCGIRLDWNQINHVHSPTLIPICIPRRVGDPQGVFSQDIC